MSQIVFYDISLNLWIFPATNEFCNKSQTPNKIPLIILSQKHAHCEHFSSLPFLLFNKNGFSFRDSFERWDFSDKWSSCANKYQERDKIWFVGVYWSVEKIFSLNLQQNHKKWSPKPCQLKCKQTLKVTSLFTKSSFLIFIQPIW